MPGRTVIVDRFPAHIQCYVFGAVWLRDRKLGMHVRLVTASHVTSTNTASSSRNSFSVDRSSIEVQRGRVAPRSTSRELSHMSQHGSGVDVSPSFHKFGLNVKSQVRSARMLGDRHQCRPLSLCSFPAKFRSDSGQGTKSFPPAADVLLCEPRAATVGILVNAWPRSVKPRECGQWARSLATCRLFGEFRRDFL